MHTEAKAREKWCPFARAVATFNNNGETVCASYNRAVTSWQTMKHTHCIASDCVVWRWDSDKIPNEVPNGYCGLAGKPE
jgi:hypothetical protein